MAEILALERFVHYVHFLVIKVEHLASERLS